MKLKDGLLLREVAGQYVIVPTGKRVQEFPRVNYMTADAAYLWNRFTDTTLQYQTSRQSSGNATRMQRRK